MMGNEVNKLLLIFNNFKSGKFNIGNSDNSLASKNSTCSNLNSLTTSLNTNIFRLVKLIILISYFLDIDNDSLNDTFWNLALFKSVFVFIIAVFTECV